ncbi:MAG: hypothetical protein AAGK37_07255 [Pseudomonadota bacterium]
MTRLQKPLDAPVDHYTRRDACLLFATLACATPLGSRQVSARTAPLDELLRVAFAHMTEFDLQLVDLRQTPSRTWVKVVLTWPPGVRRFCAKANAAGDIAAYSELTHRVWTQLHQIGATPEVG